MHRRTTTALLPLMFNPLYKLAPNKDKALYNQQVKKLNQNSQDKEDVIQSEAKLQSLGHVEFVKVQNNRKCWQRIQFKTSSLGEQFGIATQ